MAQEGQTAALYDFLYRDAGRVASYYAQLWGGRLAGTVETDSDNQTTSKVAYFALPPVTAGDVASTQRTGQQSRRNIDPHDVIITDVLARLTSDGRVREDVRHAPNGALVRAKGTVLFIDHNMLEIARGTVSAIGNFAGLGSEHQAIIQTAVAMLQAIAIPSAFVLQDGGLQVVGTIKESGMEEPIPTYYFKHGAAGLHDVHIIGIKEVPACSVAAPGCNSSMIDLVRNGATSLADALFPTEAIRVTPLALFRVL